MLANQNPPSFPALPSRPVSFFLLLTSWLAMPVCLKYRMKIQQENHGELVSTQKQSSGQESLCHVGFVFRCIRHLPYTFVRDVQVDTDRRGRFDRWVVWQSPLVSVGWRLRTGDKKVSTVGGRVMRVTWMLQSLPIVFQIDD